MPPASLHSLSVLASIQSPSLQHMPEQHFLIASVTFFFWFDATTIAVIGGNPSKPNDMGGFEKKLERGNRSLKILILLFGFLPHV